MEVKNLKVADIKHLAEKHWFLELENSFNGIPQPGQFIHIKIPPFFLRRPFSIAGCTRDKISILFKIVGDGSKALSRARQGDVLNVIGPLGKPFPIRNTWKRVFLVGGGTGIAPLLFLSEELIKKEKQLLFFYGAKNKKHIMFHILPYGVDFIFSTEDGSFGQKGSVHISLVQQMEKRFLPDVIYAGGPSGLLRQVAIAAGRYGIPTFVSLENRFACGTGLCYGCVTRIKSKKGWEYKRVCRDGPVFDAADIIWEEQ